MTVINNACFPCFTCMKHARISNTFNFIWTVYEKKQLLFLILVSLQGRQITVQSWKGELHSMCSKLVIKTPEHIIKVFLVYLSLTLNTLSTTQRRIKNLVKNLRWKFNLPAWMLQRALNARLHYSSNFWSLIWKRSLSAKNRKKSGSAQVQILFTACRWFAKVRISNNGNGWK